MKPLSALLWAALGAGCSGEPAEVLVPAPAPVEAPAPAAEPAAEPAPTAAPAAKLDLNTATEEELGKVPGAGERMVHEFVEYRPYVSIAQFRKEMGKYVDAATIAGFEQHLYVPVDPDTSDTETLQQLPGIDAAEAQVLISGRPYASREAFLEALAAKASAEEVEAGKALLKAP